MWCGHKKEKKVEAKIYSIGSRLVKGAVVGTGCERLDADMAEYWSFPHLSFLFEMIINWQTFCSNTLQGPSMLQWLCQVKKGEGNAKVNTARSPLMGFIIPSHLLYLIHSLLLSPWIRCYYYTELTEVEAELWSR